MVTEILALLRQYQGRGNKHSSRICTKYKHDSFLQGTEMKMNNNTRLSQLYRQTELNLILLTKALINLYFFSFTIILRLFIHFPNLMYHQDQCPLDIILCLNLFQAENQNLTFNDFEFCICNKLKAEIDCTDVPVVFLLKEHKISSSC